MQNYTLKLKLNVTYESALHPSILLGNRSTIYLVLEIISSLYKTQFFKDIEVSEVNQTLKITVIENPHIKYIVQLRMALHTSV
jgi:outer membrane protein assembly factor BamA